MVITLGGEYGDGGKGIAKRLAALLDYWFCGDNIVTEAVKDSDVDMVEETFRYCDESQPCTERRMHGPLEVSILGRAAHTV